MHEMSITQSVIELCTEKADGRSVISVTLEIGTLAGVVPEAIQFCFEACVGDTPLGNAILLIERIAAVGRCRKCLLEFPIESCYEPCPRCGLFGAEIIAGEELRVKELEVE